MLTVKSVLAIVYQSYMVLILSRYNDCAKTVLIFGNCHFSV